MGVKDIVKLMGNFTLAQFMAHDTFRNRYEQGLPLGLHELIYPLLQAYDSVAVQSDVELGATEQKFNILCGRDMQRYFGQEEQVAILTSLLIGLDGINKMGKSLNNYIAVFDPPEEKFGKIMSIPDNLILNYYKYAAWADEEELDAIQKALDNGTNPMILKKQLAHRIVAFFHSEQAADEAQRTFEKVFSQRELPDNIPEYNVSYPVMRITKLLTESGMCESGSEAKRLIQAGGVSINGEKITSTDMDIEIKDGMVLRVGKRKFLRLRKQ
jgi:tyrosyl-tRNA synthetase